MSSKKNKRQPKTKLAKSQKNYFFSLVKKDATFSNKLVKWVIIIHYPFYLVSLVLELINMDYAKNGYIGPASMIFPMSLAGEIIMEIAYFIIISSISVSLLIAMKSYKENFPDTRMKH